MRRCMSRARANRVKAGMDSCIRSIGFRIEATVLVQKCCFLHRRHRIVFAQAFACVSDFANMQCVCDLRRSRSCSRHLRILHKTPSILHRSLVSCTETFLVRQVSCSWLPRSAAKPGRLSAGKMGTSDRHSDDFHRACAESGYIAWGLSRWKHFDSRWQRCWTTS